MASRKPNLIFVIYACLAIGYILLTLLLPASASTLRHYHLTVSQAHAISLGVVVPYAIIWFMAFFGYDRLRKYSSGISKQPDGQPMQTVTRGLQLLAFSLPVASIISSLSSYVGSRSGRLMPASTIVSNYVNLAIVFVAFYFLWRGTQRLTQTLGTKPDKPNERLLLLFFIASSVLFVYLSLTNPVRQFPSATVDHAAYYMTDWLLILTILIPYIVIWFWGIFSAYNVYLYRKYVSGVLYQRALGELAVGIGVTIIGIMAIRFLVSLTTMFSNLRLQALLTAIYLLLIVIALGFGLIAFGAKKLQKIEEV